MRRMFHVLQAPDGAIALMTTYRPQPEAGDRGASRLESLLAGLRQHIDGDEFEERFGDREMRVVLATSGELGALEQAVVRRFTEHSGVAVDVEILPFPLPPEPSPSAVELHEAGIALHRDGDSAGAIAKVTEALAQARDDDDVHLQSVALNSLGMIHHAAGHLDEAERLLRAALPLRRETGDRRGEGITENNFGLVCSDLGRFDEAREHFERSLQLRREVGDEEGAFKTLTNLSDLESRAGRQGAHHGALDAAAVQADELADAAIEPGVGLAAAAALNRAGRHQEAVVLYRRAATAARDRDDQGAELIACYDMAVILATLGRRDEACTAFDRAEQLAIDRAARDRHAAILLNRSGVLAGLGKPDEAVHDAQLAVALARELDDARTTGSALNALGTRYHAMGMDDAAVAAHEQALALAHDNDNTRGAVIAGINLALVLSDTGDYARALERTAEARAAAREANDDDGVGFGGWAHGRIAAQHGRTREARAAFAEAVAAVESWREGIGGDELRSSAFGSVDYVYADAVEFSAASGDTTRAFEVADAAKSRWFADQLGSGPLPVPPGLDPDDPRLVRERALQAEQQRLERALQGGEDPGAGATYARQGALRRDLAAVWSELAPDAPGYIALRRGDPTRVAEVRDALGAAAAVVQLFVGRDEVVAMVVRPDSGEPALVRTGVAARTMAHRVTSFRREVADYLPGDAVDERWQEFGRSLIEPVVPHLGGLDLVYFSAHRELHSLPFHAVRVSGAPLADQIAVAYTPSASVLRLVVERERARPAGSLGGPLVLGFTADDDEREDFEGEAHDVAALLGTRAHVGAASSSALLRDAGRSADVIHLSCHGRFDSADPMSSHVVLADGPVTARDIIGLDLHARLVTISACQTGESGVAAGDELMGLTRAFLYAGASAVIVTMWEVDARAARRLMAEFYAGGAEGLHRTAPAQRLQAAMRAQRATHEHPFYWAPFIVVGHAGATE